MKRDDVAVEYTRWFRELLRYVHRLTGDADLAEDVAQEALLRLLECTNDRPDANPRLWLFRVATNLVRDLGRHRRMAERAELPEPTPLPRPDAEYEQAERVRIARAALDALAPRDREILIMRASGFRHSEIADVIGVKSESVSMLALRALDRFRNAVLAEDIDAAST